jgi:hypothetical protein
MGDPHESVDERRHEQVAAVEEILDSVDPALEEHAYPVSSEELAAHYGSTSVELPNETESLGSVFDRLDDREFDSPMAVREEVLRAASDASPEPPGAGAGRSTEADHGGTPREVVDDLATDAVAGSTRTQDTTDGGPGPGAPRGSVDTATDPEADAAEPGEETTPDSTEADEFAPTETLEDSDREGDRRASAGRSSDRRASREPADEEPGDPAEPTTEPAEEELDAEERAAEVPDARDGVDPSEPSEPARYAGDGEEPLEGSSDEERTDSPVPDARDEDRDVTREGNVPDEEDGGA